VAVYDCDATPPGWTIHLDSVTCEDVSRYVWTGQTAGFNDTNWQMISETVYDMSRTLASGSFGSSCLPSNTTTCAGQPIDPPIPDPTNGGPASVTCS
jgi:hypothetical protein